MVTNCLVKRCSTIRLGRNYGTASTRRFDTLANTWTAASSMHSVNNSFLQSLFLQWETIKNGLCY
jgi:hypothetical protein